MLGTAQGFHSRGASKLSCEAGTLTEMNQPLLKIKQTKLMIVPKSSSNNSSVRTPSSGRPEIEGENFDGIDESNEIDFDHRRD